MNKFVKRLRKMNRKARNVLVVGDAWGNLDEILENYSSVFLIDDHKRIFKAKNLIYRENYDNLHQLQDVDLIILSLDHENRIQELFPVLRKCSPILIAEGSGLISKENQTFLKSHNYFVVEIHKTYYQWKLR